METCKRNCQLHFLVSEEEQEAINSNMIECGFNNFSLYARKMLLDGVVIKIDFTDIKNLTKEFGYLNRNLNQITKRINETRNIHSDDIIEIRKIVNEMKSDISEFISRMYNKIDKT